MISSKGLEKELETKKKELFQLSDSFDQHAKDAEKIESLKRDLQVKLKARAEKLKSYEERENAKKVSVQSSVFYSLYCDFSPLRRTSKRPRIAVT